MGDRIALQVIPSSELLRDERLVNMLVSLCLAHWRYLSLHPRHDLFQLSHGRKYSILVDVQIPI